MIFIVPCKQLRLQLFVHLDTFVLVNLTKKSVVKGDTQRKVLVCAKIVSQGSSVRKQSKRNHIGAQLDIIVIIQARNKPANLVQRELNIIWPNAKNVRLVQNVIIQKRNDDFYSQFCSFSHHFHGHISFSDGNGIMGITKTIMMIKIR